MGVYGHGGGSFRTTSNGCGADASSRGVVRSHGRNGGAGGGGSGAGSGGDGCNGDSDQRCGDFAHLCFQIEFLTKHVDTSAVRASNENISIGIATEWRKQ